MGVMQLFKNQGADLSDPRVQARMRSIEAKLPNQPKPVDVPQPEGTNNTTIGRDFQREADVAKRLKVTTSELKDPAAQQFLFAQTYSPEELSALGLSEGFVNEFGNITAQTNQARADLFDERGESKRPNRTNFQPLEDALREATGVGELGLGESELFQAAGLTSFDNLMQSLNARQTEMEMAHQDFARTFQQVARGESDRFQASLDRFNVLNTQRKELIGRIQDIEDRANRQKDELELIRTRHNLDIELENVKAANKGVKDPKAGTLLNRMISASLSGTPEGGFTAGPPTPKVNTNVLSSFGESIITGFGSSLWKHGLDFVLPGGLNADIVMPLAGRIIDVVTGRKPGEEKSFGNQVKVEFEDGNQAWFSHLSDVLVEAGQEFKAGEVVGKQGNTGSTLGPTGIHVDLTMPDGKGGFRKPEDVAKYFGFGDPSSADLNTLTSLQSAFQNSELKLDPVTMDTITSLVVSNQLTLEEAIDGFMTDKSPDALKKRYQQDLGAMVRGINNNDFEVGDAISVLEGLNYQQRNIDKDLMENGVPAKKIYQYRFPQIVREYVEDREEMFNLKLGSIGSSAANIIQNPIDVWLTRFEQGGKAFDEWVGRENPRRVKEFISEEMFNELTAEIMGRFPTMTQEKVEDDIRQGFRIIQ